MGWKPNLTRRRKEKKSTCTPKVRFVWAEVGSNLAEKAFQSLSERQFVRVRSRVRAPRLPKADRFDSFCVLIATDASLQHYDTADELRLSGADTFKHSNIYIYIYVYICFAVPYLFVCCGWADCWVLHVQNSVANTWKHITSFFGKLRHTER